MTNLEMLRTGTPEQIKDIFCDMFCDKYGNCSNLCPSFLFYRCGGGKNGVLEWLNDESKVPKNTSEHVPKGWIKLKEKDSDIYINVSQIVGISLPPPPYVSDKVLTAIYTVDAEKTPWIVHENINEVMRKIEKTQIKED